MSEAGCSGWWRFTGFAIVGGGVALGGWFVSQHPAAGDPLPKFAPVASDSNWVRAPNQPGQLQPKAAAPGSGELIQTAGSMPQVPAQSFGSSPTMPGMAGASSYGSMPSIPPAMPSIPSAPALLPVPAPSYSVGAGSIPPAMPAIPASGVMPVAPATAPVVPAIPPLPTTAPGLPAIPALPTIPVQAVAQAGPGTPALPAIPSPSALPTASTGPGTLPAVPSSPMYPPPGGFTPPASIAPTAPPLQFPDSIQPVMPVRPESGLPGRNEGITVKPGSPTEAVAPGLPYKIPVTSLDTIPDRPKPVDGPLPYSERDTFAFPAANTPGDTAMILYRQRAAALAVLGGMILIPGSPVDAADPQPDNTAALKKQLEDNAAALKEIKGQLTELKDLVKEMMKTKPNDSVMAQLEALKKSVEAIERQLTSLQTQSLRPSTAGPPIGEIKTALGTVRIVNEYPVPISMVINGTSYPVEPRKAVDVPVPAGDFTYQLVQSGAAPTKSAIKDKETVTLRIK